jgi:hypothetical protein
VATLYFVVLVAALIAAVAYVLHCVWVVLCYMLGR